MHRVAGEEDPPVLVAVGEQQVLPPFADVEHLVLHRHADGKLELACHLGVVVHHRVQRPVPCRVLHDEEAPALVGDVVVPAVPGPCLSILACDGDAVEQLVAAVQRLAQLAQVLALHRDAELLADHAVSAIAAHEVLRPYFTAGNFCRNPQRLGLLLQQRLERVLRDELIGLEGHRAVHAGVDRPLRLGDRRILMTHQRRLVERSDDVDVHRHIGAQARGAHLVRETHTAVDLHGARVAALHLRQELRRVLALDERAAHASLSEIDGEREADRTGADDEHFCVEHG